MAAARLRSAAARLRPGLAAAGAGARGERRPLGTAAAEAVTADAGAVAAGVLARWELMGARDYYDYRRAIYGDITHKAILVDAAGTLLAPTEPMAQVRSVPPHCRISPWFSASPFCLCDLTAVCMFHFSP